MGCPTYLAPISKSISAPARTSWLEPSKSRPTYTSGHQPCLEGGRYQAQFSQHQTIEVGSFPPNAWGLHDMHGNVWEWCEGNLHPTYQGAPDDGSVWKGSEYSSRMLCGGSWIGYPQDVRSASRVRDQPGSYGNFVGFRVARTL